MPVFRSSNSTSFRKIIPMRKIRFVNLLIFIKKRALLCFLAAYCLLPADSSAQGNLQFNQVIMYDMTSGGTQNITVPAGKVWKIESASTSNGSTVGVSLRNAALQNIGILSTSTAASNFPIWLPTGFTGSFYNNAAGRSMVSILEFNVVP